MSELHPDMVRCTGSDASWCAGGPGRARCEHYGPHLKRGTCGRGWCSDVWKRVDCVPVHHCGNCLYGRHEPCVMVECDCDDNGNPSHWAAMPVE